MRLEHHLVGGYVRYISPYIIIIIINVKNSVMEAMVTTAFMYRCMSTNVSGQMTRTFSLDEGRLYQKIKMEHTKAN